MLTLTLLSLVETALAQDDPSEAPPPAPTAPDVEALEARVQELEARLDAAEAAALIREAEALAAASRPEPPPPSVSANTFNPSITAFGDVLGTWLFDEGELDPASGPWLRSLELDIQADVDPFARAVAVLALHQEPPLGGHGHGDEEEQAEEEGEEHAEEGEDDAHGAFTAAPEEVYVDLVALPGGLSARIGAFRQPFGVTNRAHPHDYPWTDTPAPLAEHLGPEGWADAGATLSWNRALGPAAITLTGGALDGAGLYDPERESPLPQWLGRAELFADFGSVDLGLGSSHTGLEEHYLGGADLMLRWRGSSWRSAVLLAEGFVDQDGELGGYGALQLQPTRPLYLGARVDWADELAWGGFLSYYTSEFLRLRTGAMVDEHDLTLHAQLTFVWGSHPVEPYWVNR